MFSRRKETSFTLWWLICASALSTTPTSFTRLFSTAARLLSTRANSARMPRSAKAVSQRRSLASHLPFQCRRNSKNWMRIALPSKKPPSTTAYMSSNSALVRGAVLSLYCVIGYWRRSAVW